MASYINRGESVFFQFRNGKTVLNSQCKPRMFKTAEKATLGVNYVDTDEIVEYVEKNAQQKWIPVTERLPENPLERVLALCLGDYPVGNPKMDTDRCRDGRWVRYGKDVTHWMPLPQSPKEGE